MEEWKEYKLGEVCTELSDGLHKAPKFKFGGDYIFVNAKNIVNGFIVDNDPTKKSSYEEFLKYASPLNDTTILYSIDGTIGNVALYRGEKCILGKGACYLNPNPNVLDRLFLYYELQSPRFKGYIDRMSTGSTIKHISLKTMRNYSFTFPSIKRQRQISSILKSLDDKIEVNRRINDNLEQQAQALFKSWFVDFEPFRDQPFVESELGMIPEGWRVGTLGDYVETTSGGTPSRKIKNYYEGGNICWVKSKELANGFITETEEQISDIAVKQSAAKVLPKHSVLIAMYGATVGEYGIISQPMTCNQAICALLPNNKVPYSILYMLAKNNKENLQSKAIGSAQQNVSQAIIKRLKIKYNTEVFCDFNCIIEPMLNRIEATTIESRRLAELRDTLLPRLMSGEIKVGDVTL